MVRVNKLTYVLGTVQSSLTLSHIPIKPTYEVGITLVLQMRLKNNTVRNRPRIKTQADSKTHNLKYYVILSALHLKTLLQFLIVNLRSYYY